MENSLTKNIKKDCNIPEACAVPKTFDCEFYKTTKTGIYKELHSRKLISDSELTLLLERQNKQ